MDEFPPQLNTRSSTDCFLLQMQETAPLNWWTSAARFAGFINQQWNRLTLLEEDRVHANMFNANGEAVGTIARRTNNVGAWERIASIGAGSLLVAQAFRRPSWKTAAGALLGAEVVYRGVTGHCHFYGALGVNTAESKKPGSQIPETAPEVHRSITIGRSPEELYAFWRDEHNLAQIMGHLAEVTPGVDSFTHWRVRGPLQQVFEWDSRITSDEPGQKIAWESLPGTEVPNRGEVIFAKAPDGIGGEVTLRMQFEPPLGAAGARLMKSLNKVPRAITGNALRRFKSLMETGEIPTLAHNPSGRGSSDSF